MILPRALLHALAILVVINVGNTLVAHAQLPGFTFALGLLRYGAFVPFSVAAAAGLHRQRALVVALVVITLLAAWPFSIADLSHVLTPIAIGLLIGTGLRNLIAESQSSTRGATTNAQ